MLTRMRRQVRLLTRRCPYCVRRLIPGARIAFAKGVLRCPAFHYAEVDFGVSIAVFDEGGRMIDLRPEHRHDAFVA